MIALMIILGLLVVWLAICMIAPEVEALRDRSANEGEPLDSETPERSAKA